MAKDRLMLQEGHMTQKTGEMPGTCPCRPKVSCPNGLVLLGTFRLQEGMGRRSRVWELMCPVDEPIPVGTGEPSPAT